MTHADRTLAENTISVLAVRKFIYKSEMRALLASLSDKTVTLHELEELLFSLIDITVIYVDDDPVKPNAYVAAISLKRKLRQQGYGHIGEYFDSVQTICFPEMVLIWESIAPDRRPSFAGELAEILSDSRMYERYLMLETADFFFDALDRIAEGDDALDSEKQAPLIERVAEHMGTATEEAEALVKEGLRQVGVQIPELELSKDVFHREYDHTTKTTRTVSNDRNRRE
jgi:hypothetical protein